MPPERGSAKEAGEEENDRKVLWQVEGGREKRMSMALKIITKGAIKT